MTDRPTATEPDAMDRERPLTAVLADMDGVLTDTAGLHREAWRAVFAPILAAHADQPPFGDDDYLQHVDGKPRHAGVRDFLAARGIEIPSGAADDPPGEATVHGLAAAKDERFRERLAAVGVNVFEDARPALARWRRGGLRLAAFSASRNARRVLAAAGLDAEFDVVVDGVDAARDGLADKRAIAGAAASRLGVEPGDAVLIEDAVAGVAAGAAVGFGVVAGIARRGGSSHDALRRAGATTVAADLFRLRFRRRVPRLLDRRDEFDQWCGGRPLALFLDFDGTLAEIVDDPADARPVAGLRRTVAELAERTTVAVISGRDRADVAERLGIDGIVIAGNHGFDIRGRGIDRTLPDAARWVERVDAAERQLRERTTELPGVGIERKRFSVAVHVRRTDSERVRACATQAVETVRREQSLRVRRGKQVFELEPPVEWDKGRALQWIQASLPSAETDDVFAVYIGDDETDEDAFAALCGRGAGVFVGPEVSDTRADYRARDPAEVLTILEWLVARPRR